MSIKACILKTRVKKPLLVQGDVYSSMLSNEKSLSQPGIISSKNDKGEKNEKYHNEKSYNGYNENNNRTLLAFNDTDNPCEKRRCARN